MSLMFLTNFHNRYSTFNVLCQSRFNFPLLFIAFVICIITLYFHLIVNKQNSKLTLQLYHWTRFSHKNMKHFQHPYHIFFNKKVFLHLTKLMLIWDVKTIWDWLKYYVPFPVLYLSWSGLLTCINFLLTLPCTVTTFMNNKLHSYCYY